MKILVGSEIGGYTFNKTAKTVTLTGLATITLDKVLIITNVTSNTIIYSFDTASLGGTISSNVITLVYDTSAMNNADKLMIFIDYPGSLVSPYLELLAASPALGQATMANSVPVTVSSNQTVKVGGSLRLVGVEFTRPTDTTAYAALDVVGNNSVITFAAIAREDNASGYITKARLVCDQKTNTARHRLHLFTSSPTAINDNSPFLNLYANNAIKVGYIDFAAMATEDSSSSTAASSLNTDIRLAFITSGSDDLFGILETLDAYTPANAGKYYVELTNDSN